MVAKKRSNAAATTTSNGKRAKAGSDAAPVAKITEYYQCRMCLESWKKGNEKYEQEGELDNNEMMLREQEDEELQEKRARRMEYIKDEIKRQENRKVWIEKLGGVDKMHPIYEEPCDELSDTESRLLVSETMQQYHERMDEIEKRHEYTEMVDEYFTQMRVVSTSPKVHTHRVSRTGLNSARDKMLEVIIQDLRSGHSKLATPLPQSDSDLLILCPVLHRVSFNTVETHSIYRYQTISYVHQTRVLKKLCDTLHITFTFRNNKESDYERFVDYIYTIHPSDSDFSNERCLQVDGKFIRLRELYELNLCNLEDYLKHIDKEFASLTSSIFPLADSVSTSMVMLREEEE